MKKRILPLALAISLLLTACGGGASAATMHLRKTEGAVSVADSDGKGVEPKENLGLYSGYGVNTLSESYAWIDLDRVKLTKLDQDSEIAIQKEGKKLEIEVKSGALFFNVTEPLADDETMEIRTSSMLIGIRGTCGWVEVPDSEHMNVYLLEGKVECSAGGETVAVNAGERAEMSFVDGRGAITVSKLQDQAIPAFVVDELDGVQPGQEGGENEDSSAPDNGWPRVTESVLDDGSVYIVEYYEDGSYIERMTREDFSSVQERDTRRRVVRDESAYGGSNQLYTYHYQEGNPEVVVSALWTEDGETVVEVEGFFYTMTDPGNGIRVSGLSLSGGVDDNVRTLTISEFRMDTTENIRATSFDLDIGGSIIETRDEDRSEGRYG